MEVVALLIALISLALAGVAYWRAGGRRDVEHLRAKQKELADALLFVIEEMYEESRLSLRQTADGLQQLKTEAIHEVEQQLDRAAQQLAALEKRLEDGLKSARNTAMSTAHEVERSLRRRVRRLEARGSLLFAKAAGALAIRHAQRGELSRAEKRLDEATALLALARETMRADHAYDEQFDTVKRSLAEAINAVRAEAADIRQRIEHVVAETDKLVGALEADEQKAAAATEGKP
jgi:regulator of replication initiation timing